MIGLQTIGTSIMCGVSPIGIGTRIPSLICGGSRSLLNNGGLYNNGAMKKFSTVEIKDLKKTPLYDLHVEKGGQTIDLFGWAMPVQYKDDGVLKEHMWCREKASIFDVSHMGQVKVWGKDRIAFLESLVVGDLQALKENSILYSLFLNEKGGIIDDTVITKCEDHMYVVVNSACWEKDIAHILKHAKDFDVDIEHLYDTHALVALQGPKAEEILSNLVDYSFVPKLKEMPFLTRSVTKVAGIKDCIVSRCGYTGEDGFEISIPEYGAVGLTEALLCDPQARLAGLGARDSLRLEAGLCLYGNDLNEDISPIEATLTWTVGKRRRVEGGFLGADTVQKQLKEGVEKKRVGMVVLGAPARDHTVVYSLDGREEIGMITSGTRSPVAKENIAMAYVPKKFADRDTELMVKVREKLQPARIVRMPFVKHNYKIEKK